MWTNPAFWNSFGIVWNSQHAHKWQYPNVMPPCEKRASTTHAAGDSHNNATSTNQTHTNKLQYTLDRNRHHFGERVAQGEGIIVKTRTEPFLSAKLAMRHDFFIGLECSTARSSDTMKCIGWRAGRWSWTKQVRDQREQKRKRREAKIELNMKRKRLNEERNMTEKSKPSKNTLMLGNSVSNRHTYGKCQFSPTKIPSIFKHNY